MVKIRERALRNTGRLQRLVGSAPQTVFLVSNLREIRSRRLGFADR